MIDHVSGHKLALTNLKNGNHTKYILQPQCFEIRNQLHIGANMAEE